MFDETKKEKMARQTQQQQQQAESRLPEKIEGSIQALNVSNMTNEEALSNAFAEMKSKKSSELQEMTGSYFNVSDLMKIDEERDFILTAFGVMKNDKGEDVKTVNFVDEGMEQWTSASTVLVNSLLKSDHLPAAFRIKYLGRKKSANGSYDAMKVWLF